MAERRQQQHQQQEGREQQQQKGEDEKAQPIVLSFMYTARDDNYRGNASERLFASLAGLLSLLRFVFLSKIGEAPIHQAFCDLPIRSPTVGAWQPLQPDEHV